MPGVGPAVQLSRRFDVSSRKGTQPLGGFGAWDIDVPFLVGTFDATYKWNLGGNGATNRCSEFWYPATREGMQLSELWSGTQMHVPGAGNRELLYVDDHGAAPAGVGGPSVWRARDDIRFGCTTSVANGSGQGFIAIDSEGTKTTFDVMIERGNGVLTKMLTRWGTTNFPRTRVYLMASRVEDRHGNWVNYTYAGDRLTYVTAKDGRQIALTWTGDRIFAAAAHGRTWSYQYAATRLGNPGAFPLSDVYLPDHTPAAPSKWHYSYGRTSGVSTNLLMPLYPTPDVPNDFRCMEADNAYDEFVLTATHPAGVEGRFAFQYTRHYRSGIPASTCVADGRNNWSLLVPDYSDVYSIYSKTFSGPGLPVSGGTQPLESWQYGYEISAYGRVGTLPPCTTCTQFKENWVDSPDGSRQMSRFGIVYGLNDGRLLQSRTYASIGAPSPLTTTTNDYLTEASAPYQPFPDLIGLSFVAGEPADQAPNRNRPIVRTTRLQQGVTFTSDHGCTTTTTVCFDAFVRPLTTTQSSSLGTSRTVRKTYLDNTSTWVLGKVLTNELRNNLPFPGSYVTTAQTTYHASALPYQTWQFGKLQDTRTWNADGSLWTVADGLYQTTTLGNYMRGIPQTIGYQNGSTESAVVDALGQITSVTSAAGFTTSYQYDNGGRINKLIHPASDTVAWSETNRVYQSVSTPEFGLAAGHWKRTETTGNATSVTYYDGRWRPVLTQVYDAASPSTTQRMVLSRFDAENRNVFASYPQSGIASIAAIPDGVTSAFDALGRLTSTQAASELGALNTSIYYWTGFQKQIVNPRGNATTTSYQVFDEPSEDAPVTISEPMATTTTITRDVFGLPTAMVRSGTYLGSSISATRRYVYDSYKRLCKTIEPESGVTVVAYDAANNVDWRAAGQSAFFGSTTDCQQASVVANQKTDYTYDSRNRLTDTTYGDGSPAINTSYTPDGLPSTVTSDGSTWTYGYNKRRLLESENLTLGANSYAIGHGYTANGHEGSQTYPNGAVINYWVNALGEQTRVGSYVYNVTRHPNGAVANFSYGNGITHTGTQTSRGLPDLSSDASTSVNVLNDDYNWDESGNVMAIASGIGAGATRHMQYDARDRLIQTTYDKLGPAAVDFTYDPLDNLRTYVTPGRNYVHDYQAGTGRLQRIYQMAGSTQVDKYIYAYVGAAGDRGNVTTRSKLDDATSQVFGFDQGNRLRSLSGTTAQSYSYDGMGRRTRITTSATVYRHQVYSQSGKLVYERLFSHKFTDGPQEVSYLYLGNHLVARAEGAVGGTAVRTFLHTDGLGSPVAETDAVGALVAGTRSLHEPYGLRVITGSTPSPLRQGPGYTGHVLDAATGLSYMQQRYYDPIAARFLSVDPVAANAATGGNFNRYWYANNNPYKFVDPDGRYVCTSGKAGQCDNFDKALALVKDASSNPKLSKTEQKMMGAIVSAYGKKGDDSVRVSFSAGSAGSAGSAKQMIDSATGKAYNQVKIDSGKIPGGDASIDKLAGAVAHEGQHVADNIARGGNIKSREERRATEIGAYTSEASVYKSAGYLWATQLWTPAGGVNEIGVQQAAEISMRVSCSGAPNSASCQ